jgi:hypothetical protein
MRTDPIKSQAAIAQCSVATKETPATPKLERNQCNFSCILKIPGSKKKVFLHLVKNSPN